ncbi:hypothetical protein ZWY2020_051860 [Hordeum vulgare]|nr:hypothetical protein ZWY2020_051860 [Hordeum vulgare]
MAEVSVLQGNYTYGVTSTLKWFNLPLEPSPKKVHPVRGHTVAPAVLAGMLSALARVEKHTGAWERAQPHCVGAPVHDDGDGERTRAMRWSMREDAISAALLLFSDD